jgi:hypothetical protein
MIACVQKQQQNEFILQFKTLPSPNIAVILTIAIAIYRLIANCDV